MLRTTLLSALAAALLACGSSSNTTCPPAPAPASPAAAASSPSTQQRLADIRKGIVQKSATDVEIDRGTLNEILDHQPELMSSSRIVPEQEKGKVVGVRFFGAPPDSLLGMLGIQDGDRVETVNGVDMSSRDQALAVLSGLRKAEHVTVVLNRAGQEMTIEYSVK